MEYLWTPVGRACMVLLGAVSLVAVVAKVMEPKLSYKGKHVVITGGSFGIGLEIAKEYVNRGANVTIVARNVNRLKEAQKTLEGNCKSGQKINIVGLDISSDIDVAKEKFKPAIDELGDVAVLVNNAGTSIAGAFDCTDVVEFTRMFQVNVQGSMNVTRALLDSLKKASAENGSGRIVFVSSQVAQAPIYGYSAYASSKWALRGIAEVLQMELKPYGLYVSVAYPPDTNTPGYEAEMLTKPEITKKISESGSVFSASEVASDIVQYSTQGYFNISTGLDGWLLRQLHPGMGPVNNAWECIQPIIFAPLARIISVIYVLGWDQMATTEVMQNSKRINESNGKEGKKKK